MQLVHTQTGELCQTHVDDGLRLNLVKLETLLQVALCVARGLRTTDDVNHLVDIVASNDEAFEYVCTLLCLLKVELCTAYCYVVTMLNEVLYTLLEGQQAWTAIDQSNAVDRE